jgi:hypothetical protein
MGRGQEACCWLNDGSAQDVRPKSGREQGSLDEFDEKESEERASGLLTKWSVANRSQRHSQLRSTPQAFTFVRVQATDSGVPNGAPMNWVATETAVKWS